MSTMLRLGLKNLHSLRVCNEIQEVVPAVACLQGQAHVRGLQKHL